MKYCENCNAENLNEQIFCRKCNHQFEDFDWNTVERENVYADSLNDQFRQTEQDLHEKHFNVSLKKDGIKFIIWTVICIYGMYYGIQHSWLCYYISIFIYGLLFIFKYYKLFFKLFNVRLQEKIGNKTFNNYRLESKGVISGGIFLWMFFYPLIYFFDDYARLVLFSGVILGGLVYILFGLDLFIRPHVFNQYNDNYYVITVYLMFIMPAGVFLGFLLGATYYSTHNDLMAVFLLGLYIITIIPVLFLDKVNKHTKHDIRVPGSWFLFYSIGAPLIPSVLLFIYVVLGLYKYIPIFL
ncbi:hypothetical protein [Methanosphaera sp. BMS]|uniref:hypothetical protein n=1 Tax=Methanosphaera sp. BMS TaxID=1789762 RepID=UPI000DC1E278|nr:hypothetical protein [Methanosphaera sp. BMS]AWX32131.1 hypothetical protein AW729_03020 [Methanosphaera sp. BMS]